MSNVLIISNLYHSSPRIPGLCKYISNYGWNPIVLTVPINPDLNFGPPDDIKDYATLYEVENPKKITYPKGLYFLLREIKSYPDDELNWEIPAFEKACSIIEGNKIDVILSSSSPVTCHIIAKNLKEKYKIPWIADFRDLWTQNHNYPYTPIRKYFETKLEIDTVKNADYLTTVSQKLVEKLKNRYTDNTYCITNGFDPSNMSAKPTSNLPKLTISYTGNIYNKMQNPNKIFSALHSLITDGEIDRDKILVRFYSPQRRKLSKLVHKYELSDCVKLFEVVPRNEAIQIQKESHALLLFNWEDPTESGVYPSKVFEYLCAQKPIIATGGYGNDAVHELLDETNAGIYAITKEDIYDCVKDIYSEYKLNNGTIKYKGNIKNINKYSYQEMAHKFGNVLNTCIQTREDNV